MSSIWREGKVVFFLFIFHFVEYETCYKGISLPSQQ